MRRQRVVAIIASQSNCEREGRGGVKEACNRKWQPVTDTRNELQPCSKCQLAREWPKTRRVCWRWLLLPSILAAASPAPLHSSAASFSCNFSLPFFAGCCVWALSMLTQFGQLPIKRQVMKLMPLSGKQRSSPCPCSSLSPCSAPSLVHFSSPFLRCTPAG